MADSYSEIIVPFATRPHLLERYTNASGGIRTGMLMEHLDSLAGSISYKHMLGPSVEHVGSIEERGFYIVTASVDRYVSLDMLARVDPHRDLRISGQVIYTGRSSMEAAVKMESIGGESYPPIFIGRFSMVCRDAATHLAKVVNPLVITDADEQKLHAVGADIKERRKVSSSRSLTRVPPSSEEAAELHSLYLTFGTSDDAPTDLPAERVWMGDTQLEKCMLMFPQERNTHNQIFGGYLMRLAYELGFANASLFTRGHVNFLSLDGISFARPVPIGSILRLTSYVLHSSSSPEYPTLVHIGVTAAVVDVETGSEQTTNEFRFTWCRGDGQPLARVVVPKTYREAMLWLEGKRALETGSEIREVRRRAYHGSL
ncbi:Thioesterase/thiol ester dehydrase-isomerase [Fistulina hepatica ATCC 64428]|uniref:Thioesterase/thiol ester dehydrase-isomerase n=1 Tax=Fistulina hepatica ATCC 64428 TaxID=1128425 RepID=A0A0D7AJZ2_9AGAR|nr:Thioesterase/thiol ester dehydrase-isomerase [Fistulina hepatica ATCC 64428]